jgi:hypothetical protein
MLPEAVLSKWPGAMVCSPHPGTSIRLSKGILSVPVSSSCPPCPGDRQRERDTSIDVCHECPGTMPEMSDHVRSSTCPVMVFLVSTIHVEKIPDRSSGMLFSLPLCDDDGEMPPEYAAFPPCVEWLHPGLTVHHRLSYGLL